MIRAQHVQSKIDLLAAREYFFNCLLRALKAEPMTTEALFGSDADYVIPKLLYMNVEFGSMVIEVTPNFIGEGNESRYYYTLSVMGEILRIGIFMPISRVLAVPVQAEGREWLTQTWNGTPFRMHDRGMGVLYEWTFSDFDPANWACAEKYVLGMRFLHFRFLCLMHNGVQELLSPTILRN